MAKCALSPSRRDILKNGAALVATLPLVGGLPRAARADGIPWNVVVICFDEVCMRDLPLVAMPNLDRLRTDAMAFSSAFCTTPVCAPTRASMLTGMYPQEHGVLSNKHVLDARSSTLVDVFHEAGYTTASYGKLHTNNAVEATGSGLGFDTIWGMSSTDWADKKKALRDPHAFAAYWDAADKPVFDAIKAAHGVQFGGTVQHVSIHQDSVLTQEALSFLDAHADDTAPFFLHLSLYAPHYALRAPLLATTTGSGSWYYNWMAGDVDGIARLAGARTDSPGWVRSNAFGKDWSTLTNDQWNLHIAKYFSDLEYTDYLLGLVLDQIESLGLSENTVVVFMSDHGEQNGHRGLLLKNTCFQESQQLPLLIRMPGVLTEGSTYDGLISAVDILPTVAGLVGLGEAIGDVSGFDLSAALWGDGGAITRSSAFVQDYISKSTRKASMFGVIDAEGWQTISYRGSFKTYGYISKAGIAEVYDLWGDPDQSTNLYGDASAADVVASHNSIETAYYLDLSPLAWPLVTVAAETD